MLLYGSDPLEVATPNMTDYITLQDATMLLKLLAKGSVSVATDTGLPVSLLRPGVWAGFLGCALRKKRGILFRPWFRGYSVSTSISVLLQAMRRPLQEAHRHITPVFVSRPFVLRQMHGAGAFGVVGCACALADYPARTQRIAVCTCSVCVLAIRSTQRIDPPVRFARCRWSSPTA